MRAWFSTVLLISLSTSAWAGVPTLPGTPGTCSHLPDHVVLVGAAGTRPDAHVGAFDVVVCRFSRPEASAVVVVSPSQNPANAAGVILGRATEPAATYLSCPDQSLRFLTDPTGTCRITLTGSVDLTQQVAGVAPAVSVFADGMYFGDLPVICYDLDGEGGVGASDLSDWIKLFSSGEPWRVADYDGDGALGAQDLSLWLDVFQCGEETESATALCP